MELTVNINNIFLITYYVQKLSLRRFKTRRALIILVFEMVYPVSHLINIRKTVNYRGRDRPFIMEMLIPR